VRKGLGGGCEREKGGDVFLGLLQQRWIEWEQKDWVIT
jgi:hypothetical protein